MKNKYIIIIALLMYSFLYIATKRQSPLDPCYEKLYDWFSKDTTRVRSGQLIYNPNQDSIICEVYDSTRNVNWTLVSDTLCEKAKSQCNKSNLTVLIANKQNSNITSWQTSHGKTISVKTCP
jgi:hypothetical protein